MGVSKDRMPSYGPQLKEQIVKKLMPPYNQSVAQVSRDTGVAVPTLYAWKQLYRNQGYVVPSKSSRLDDWDAKAKLACIIETGAMNEAQSAEYCASARFVPRAARSVEVCIRVT
jgi:transposase